MNSFGRLFRISIFGESHGGMVGVTLDGVPAGIALSEKSFAADLARRKSGKRGTTPRKESDAPHIVTGVFNGRTTGAPLTVVYYNENTLSGDYRNLVTHPRPSHADWVAMTKYKGFADYRGGGHFSGRLTLGLVTAGVVAKLILKKLYKNKIKFDTVLSEIGGCADPDRFPEIIEEALRTQDSVGGIVECTASGVPVGLGEPFFDSAESVMSHLLYSVPAVKAVEFGLGFGSAKLHGSENNDPIMSPDGATATNHSGGIVGGITNGNPVVVRVAVKPTSSISSPQLTLNTETGTPERLVIKGRHDACIAMRAVVVIESAVAAACAIWRWSPSRKVCKDMRKGFAYPVKIYTFVLYFSVAEWIF